MRIGFWQNFLIFFRHGFLLDIHNKQRLLTPFLWAATILILFSFTLGVADHERALSVFVGELYLTMLFCVHASLSQVFDPYEQDRAFLLLRTYAFHPSSWFLSQSLLSFIWALCAVLPTVFLAYVFQLPKGIDIFSWMAFAVICLSLTAMISLGVLLAAITQNSSGKEILLPLLFFPLSCPVLLAGSQSILILLSQDDSSFSQTVSVQQWFSLLIGFNIIYLVLSTLLFEEFIE